MGASCYKMTDLRADQRRFARARRAMEAGPRPPETGQGVNEDGTYDDDDDDDGKSSKQLGGAGYGAGLGVNLQLALLALSDDLYGDRRLLDEYLAGALTRKDIAMRIMQRVASVLGSFSKREQQALQDVLHHLVEAMYNR
jgi:hypothetical protein